MKFAIYTSSNLSFTKGCLILKPVLTPFFSAFSIASSVVPIFLHSSINSFIFSSFSRNLDIGWSIDMPQNVAPNNVSGLVVKTLIGLYFFWSGSKHSNSKETPVDLPIQFSCIVLTLSGQFSSFTTSSSNL